MSLGLPKPVTGSAVVDGRAGAAAAAAITPGGQPRAARQQERAVDHLGRKVITTTKEFRGETYNVETTEVPNAWYKRAGRVLGSIGAGPCLAGSYIWGSESDRSDWKKYFTEGIGSDKISTDKFGGVVPLTAQKSTKKYGFDITNRQSIREEVETAKLQGRLLRQNGHQYVLLKNSAAIIIPEGKPAQAYVRTFWNRDSGASFENPDTLERVVQCFLLAYDSIAKEGGDLVDTIVIDLDNKEVRGFYRKPDPNQRLDSLHMADKFYTVDGGIIDSMRNKWDPEKVDSKTPLHGDKVEGGNRKEERDEARAVPKQRKVSHITPPISPRSSTTRKTAPTVAMPTMTVAQAKATAPNGYEFAGFDPANGNPNYVVKPSSGIDTKDD